MSADRDETGRWRRPLSVGTSATSPTGAHTLSLSPVTRTPQPDAPPHGSASESAAAAGVATAAPSAPGLRASRSADGGGGAAASPRRLSGGSRRSSVSTAGASARDISGDAGPPDQLRSFSEPVVVPQKGSSVQIRVPGRVHHRSGTPVHNATQLAASSSAARRRTPTPTRGVEGAQAEPPGRKRSVSSASVGSTSSAAKPPSPALAPSPAVRRASIAARARRNSHASSIGSAAEAAALAAGSSRSVTPSFGSSPPSPPTLRARRGSALAGATPDPLELEKTVSSSFRTSSSGSGSSTRSRTGSALGAAALGIALGDPPSARKPPSRRGQSPRAAVPLRGARPHTVAGTSPRTRSLDQARPPASTDEDGLEVEDASVSITPFEPDAGSSPAASGCRGLAHRPEVPRLALGGAGSGAANGWTGQRPAVPKIKVGGMKANPFLPGTPPAAAGKLLLAGLEGKGPLAKSLGGRSSPRPDGGALVAMAARRQWKPRESSLGRAARSTAKQQAAVTLEPLPDALSHRSGTLATLGGAEDDGGREDLLFRTSTARRRELDSLSPSLTARSAAALERSSTPAGLSEDGGGVALQRTGSLPGMPSRRGAAGRRSVV